MRTGARAAAVATLIAVAAAACTGTSGTTSPALAPPIVDGVARGLLLVHDVDGEDGPLASYRPDGTLVVRYVEGPDDFVWQPVWSPDGRRVAWTQTIDGTNWDLVTAAVDGTDRTSDPLPGRPDYITFDPTASKILLLTPSQLGFGVVIIELDDAPEGEPFEVADVGQPYFSDFSPDGDRIVAHVGSDVRIVELDEEAMTSLAASSGHQTPAWHPRAETVVYATDEDGRNRIVRQRLDEDGADELARFDAFLLFDLDSAGERVVVSAVGPPTGDDDGSAALRRRPPRQVDADVLGPGLWIIDTSTDEALQIDDEPTAAPSWDPTGSRVLARSTGGDSGHWTVYGGDGTTTRTDEFAIAESLFAAYLPFWDQYVRSQTVWSPDGSTFVHVGRSEGGRSGVWLHDADVSGPSTFVTDGDLAFFSST
jgi:hypothetical protein